MRRGLQARPPSYVPSNPRQRMASCVCCDASAAFSRTTPPTPPMAEPLRRLRPTLRKRKAVSTSRATSPSRTMLLRVRSSVMMKRLGTRNVLKAPVSSAAGVVRATSMAMPVDTRAFPAMVSADRGWPRSVAGSMTTRASSAAAARECALGEQRGACKHAREYEHHKEVVA